MVSFSIGEVNKAGNANCRDDLPDLSKISKGSRPSPMEVEEEDEEEDMDFNPFLKDLPSPEASSSLSSEIECLDGHFISEGKNSDKQFTLVDEVQNYATADPSCSVEESLIQISGSHSEARQKPVSKDPKFAFITQPEIANSCNQIQDATAAELSCNGQHQKHTVDLDGEDAICTRTRARYSLASFTLDELETFLQETDDEDDLQNVDDEEEYKKFLAAVLLGGDGDGVNQQNPSAEDEDEDNDADFEIELEEALESDPDETTGDQTRKDIKWAGRRPETRQNKHQKGTVKSGQKLLVLEKRPLRPLLPILPNQPVASFANYGKTLIPWNAPRPGSDSSAEETNLVNGFTTQQIGQLYCLIHEHVQLLIQVFSLCILDFSRPHIASQVRELIFEMLHKRKEVLGWKNVSYPSICFCPPYSYSSVPYEIPRFITQSNPGSSPFFDANSGCSSQLPSQMAASHSTHPDKGKHENVPSGQGQVVEGYFWVPSVSRPVLTTLDVAPLDLVEKYFEDIDTVIQEYRRRHVESSSASPLQFEPLFPFSSVPSFQGVNEMFLGNVSSVVTSSIPSSPKQQPPKKTLAATLVESTKKQSVALVPTEVAKLAKNFFPLFNPALFPHKPPPGGVVNRVLFTDAEDELLALGMMEFNTDWKAIQQRFLPCKSKHQIFVRQKNQCSSKASENPIKAVRRMKTSHLTTEELSRIQEGLKVFKSDWMSVWRFVVPYRDPSLLSRQWRIALGTHRSYKQDPAGRERRRLYESNRRKRKAMNLTSWQHAFERENGNSETAPGTSNSMGKNMDNAGNTCVNEGILADCREGTYGENPCSNLKERHLPSNASLRKPPCNEQQSGDIRSEEARPQTGNVNFYTLPEYLHPPSSLSTTARRAASTRAPIYCRPYRGRSRRTHSPCMVKLAPNLPPVNLPPSVRVVSQSVFRDSQLGAPSRTFVARGNVGAIGREISDPRISQVFNSGSPKSNGSDMQKPSGNSIPVKAGLTPKTTEGCRINDNKGAEWGSPISDHHMHPLLFQAPDDGRLSYYPLDCSNSNSNPFSFFSGNQPQLNLSLFHNPPSELLVDCFTQLLKAKGSTSTSSGIDFHPLLQRSDDLSAEPGAACPYTQLSVRSRGNCVGMTRRTKSKRPRGESADLDLEMHLSLTSNEDKVRGNGNVELDRAGSMMNSSDLRSMPDNLCSNNAYGQDELFPTSNDRRYNGDEIDEQFHPEIVMEQEELSDSDDEIEENVEFECEEMTDSDGEDGSGLEPIVPVQNKDSNSVPEENDTEADHEGDEHCYKANGDLLENDTTPCLELDLASQMKDDASRTSWLSLDSCASESALLADPNQKEVIIAEGSYPSNRSYYKKKRTKSRVEGKKQRLLGPLAAAASRKPQKQAGKRNANSKDVSAGESTPGCDGKY